MMITVVLVVGRPRSGNVTVVCVSDLPRLCGDGNR